MQLNSLSRLALSQSLLNTGMRGVGAGVSQNTLEFDEQTFTYPKGQSNAEVSPIYSHEERKIIMNSYLCRTGRND